LSRAHKDPERSATITVNPTNGESQFQAFWATDRLSEKQLFERFVDFVTERLESFPDLHVYRGAPRQRAGLDVWRCWFVCPALLEVRCRSAEQMRLLNALCLFVEMAAVVEVV
jgi:hypothetical protein